MDESCSSQADMTITVADIGANDRVLSITIGPDCYFNSAHKAELSAKIRAEHESGADLIYVVFDADVAAHRRSFVPRLGLRAYPLQKPDGIDEIIVVGTPAEIRRTLFPEAFELPSEPDPLHVESDGHLEPHGQAPAAGEGSSLQNPSAAAEPARVRPEDIEMRKNSHGGHDVYFRTVYIYPTLGRSIDLPLDQWEIEDARLHVEAWFIGLTPAQREKFGSSE